VDRLLYAEMSTNINVIVLYRKLFYLVFSTMIDKGKKLSLGVANEGLSHEGVWGEWMYRFV
jgi:hypothetical protein